MFSINLLSVSSKTCQKIVKNVHHKLPEPKLKYLNSLCYQTNSVYYLRKANIHIEKLKLVNLMHFSLKMKNKIC